MLAEFSTYKLNKGNKEVKYQYIDDMTFGTGGFPEHVRTIHKRVNPLVCSVVSY